MSTSPAGIRSGLTTEDIAAFCAAVGGTGRLIGIDAGTKTYGLALSDVTRTIASPLETIERRKFAADMDRGWVVKDTLKSYSVASDQIVRINRNRRSIVANALPIRCAISIEVHPSIFQTAI